MLLAVCGLAPRPSAAEVDQPRLRSRIGETGNRKGHISARALLRSFCHCNRDFLRHGVVLLDQLPGDAEHLVLRIVGIGDETPIERMGDALNVGQQRGQHPAGAAFRRRQLEPSLGGL